jgi:aspartate aminotransferase-like enzyme
LKADFNLSIAGGQQTLKGKIFRVGHMGYCAPTDVLQYIAAMEIALVKVGKKIQLGAGVAAAQAVYLQNTTEKVAQ